MLSRLLAAGLLSGCLLAPGTSALRAGEERPAAAPAAVPLARPDALTVKRLNEALAGTGLPALPGGALPEKDAWVGLMLGADVARSRLALLPPPAAPGGGLTGPLDAGDAAALLKGVRGEDEREKLVAEARGLSSRQVEELHGERGLPFADILALPTAALRRAVFEVEREAGDHPEEAMRWRESFLVDETGKVDPAAIERARVQALALPLNPRLLPVDTAAAVAKGRPVTSAAMMDPSQNIAPTSWAWKGPGNIGGRIRSMLIHPTQPARIWIGSVGGGLWYSSNSGGSWAPVNDFLGNLAVSTLAMDPTNPNVMYAGTGEGFYNADGIRGAGIYKSADGGVNWSQLAGTANNNFLIVNRLAVAPGGSGVVLAATSAGLFRSVDGGASWTQTLSPPNRLGDVEYHPTDATRAVASGYGALLYYSANGGVSWTAATGGPSGGTGYNGGRIEVRYAKSSPLTLYATFDFGSASQLFKSADGGATYAKVFDSATSGSHWLTGQGWYSNALWVSPVDPNFVVVGGLDLYRSITGGTALTKISNWQSAPSSAHADHHGIFADPGFNGTSNRTVYFTNDGGVYRAADVATVALTAGWQELNNQLGITQFYGAAGVPSDGTIIAGAQDNGTIVFKPANGTENWVTTFGGDGGYCAADPLNPGYVYGEYVYLDIHRSTSGGAANSSSYIYSGITDANSGSTAEFIAPFILDPNNPLTLLAGGKSLWRTTNARAGTVAWTAVKASDGNNITAIAVAPGNSDNVWVGHGNGNVYRTTNGTAAAPTWTKVDDNAPALPARRVTRIAIDPANGSRVFVTFGGYTTGNVWGTTDAGLSWVNRTGTLPAAPVYGLVIPPGGGQTLYAGTDVGIFASDDGGATWGGTNIGPTLASVQELFLMGTSLVTVTHGRGVFTAPTGGNPSLLISPNGGTTGADPIPFTFSFASAVTGFTASDVTVTGGTAGAFAGGGSSYSLNVSPNAANGPVTVSVPAGAAQDAASGNPSLAGSASVTFSAAKPTLNILPTGTATNTNPVPFALTFNKPVTGFDATDLAVSGGVGGALSGPTTLADGTSVYRCNVSPVGDETTLTLSVPANAAADRFGQLTPAASATVAYDRASPFLYATAFDGAAPPAGWTTAGTDKVWEWGAPASGPNADHTGNGGKLYGTVLAGNYPDGVDTYLVTPAYDLPAAGGLPYRLRFWMWMNSESGYDGGNLEISTNGGAWTLVPSSALSLPYTGSVKGLPPSLTGWNGSGLAAWNRVRMNLSAYANSSVRFRFHFGSDSNVNFAGWYIDDLALEQDPVVTLAATDPVAADGGNPGAFTFNLFPRAPGPLTIPYGVNGAAVGGTDYNALSGSVTVPAGAGRATVPVTALNRGGARPKTTAVILAVANGTDYTVGNPNTATVFIAGEAGYDAWRTGRFTDAEFVNDAVSGPNADPDGDGVPNLLEYALGLDPKRGDVGALPAPRISTVGSNRYLTMTLVRSQSNTDLTYGAQASGDLQTWDGSSATVETTVQSNTPSAGLDTVTYRDLTPLSPGTGTGRFLRLVIGKN